MMETFECPNKPNAFITAKTCISRIKLLKKSTHRTGYAHAQQRDISELCGDCETGQAFYQEDLKGWPEMPMETKTCPCGKVFSRDKDQNQRSWNRTLNCPECRSLSCYDRKKKHSMPAQVKTDSKSATVNPELSNKKKFAASQAVSAETKPCALEGCGKMCVREPGESEGTWTIRKYCCKKCKAEAKRRRKNELRKTKVVSVFDRDRAEAVARDAADSTMAMFSVFLDGQLSHDKIKAVAIQAGIEAQRLAYSALSR